jgi:hypothetical protein
MRALLKRRSKRVTTTGAVLMLLIVGGASLVRAAIPHSDTGEIVGCYKTGNGALKVIDHQSGERCGRGEIELRWASEGEKGEKGDPGDPASLEGGSVDTEHLKDGAVTWDKFGADEQGRITGLEADLLAETTARAIAIAALQGDIAAVDARVGALEGDTSFSDFRATLALSASPGDTDTFVHGSRITGLLGPDVQIGASAIVGTIEVSQLAGGITGSLLAEATITARELSTTGSPGGAAVTEDAIADGAVVHAKLSSGVQETLTDLRGDITALALRAANLATPWDGAGDQVHSTRLTGVTTVAAQWDPSELGAGEYMSHTFAVVGAALGDLITVSPPTSFTPLFVNAYVSAPSNVTVVIKNNTAAPIDEPFGTWTITVMDLTP